MATKKSARRKKAIEAFPDYTEPRWQIWRTEEARARQDRLSRSETDRLLIEATAKLKDMVALCDRQRAELRYLRSVAAVVKSLTGVFNTLYDASKLER
jgi:hypothetical protein